MRRPLKAVSSRSSLQSRSQSLRACRRRTRHGLRLPRSLPTRRAGRPRLLASPSPLVETGERHQRRCCCVYLPLKLCIYYESLTQASSISSDRFCSTTLRPCVPLCLCHCQEKRGRGGGDRTQNIVEILNCFFRWRSEVASSLRALKAHGMFQSVEKFEWDPIMELVKIL